VFPSSPLPHFRASKKRTNKPAADSGPVAESVFVPCPLRSEKNLIVRKETCAGGRLNDLWLVSFFPCLSNCQSIQTVIRRGRLFFKTSDRARTFVNPLFFRWYQWAALGEATRILSGQSSCLPASRPTSAQQRGGNPLGTRNGRRVAKFPRSRDAIVEINARTPATSPFNVGKYTCRSGLGPRSFFFFFPLSSPVSTASTSGPIIKEGACRALRANPADSQRRRDNFHHVAVNVSSRARQAVQPGRVGIGSTLNVKCRYAAIAPRQLSFFLPPPFQDDGCIRDLFHSGAEKKTKKKNGVFFFFFLPKIVVKRFEADAAKAGLDGSHWTPPLLFFFLSFVIPGVLCVSPDWACQ